MDAPRWDLRSIYPNFLGAEYKADTKKLADSISKLSQTVARDAPKDDVVSWVADCIKDYNTSADLFGNLSSYIYAVFSTDTKNAVVAKELNRVEEIALPLKSALISFRNRLADVAAVVKKESNQAKLEEKLGERYDFFLEEQLKIQAKQMSPEEEEIAEDLARSGGSA